MSKDNLLWKLDVLEAQLTNDLDNTRLYKAKFAVEKRQTQPEIPEEQLKELIRDAKQQLVDRKVHHGILQTHRALKSTINMELLKIKKRIKKSDSSKSAALNEELNAAQGLKQHENISNYLVYRHLNKAFVTREIPEPDFFSCSLISEIKRVKQSEFVNNKAVMNVISRLCSNNSLKAVFDELSKSINRISVRGRREADKKELGSENDMSVNNSQLEQKQQAKNQQERSKDFSKDTSSSSDDKFYDSYDSILKMPQDNLKETNNPKSKSELNNVSEYDSDSNSNSNEDDFFASSINNNTSSMNNLPTLATGYFSGSEDDETDNYNYDNDKIVQQAVSERKNRRGQRARRKIWELKYGKKANHLIKEREEHIAKAQKRQQEYEERESRRQAKRLKQVQASNNTELNTHSKSHIRVQPDSIDNNKPLHPSWQAKKNQKVSASQFKGKKLKFDD